MTVYESGGWGGAIVTWKKEVGLSGRKCTSAVQGFRKETTVYIVSKKDNI